MVEKLKCETYGADTVVRRGLIGDPEFMERTLRSLPPGVLTALQEAARSIVGDPDHNLVSADAAFMTGAAAALAVLRAQEVVTTVEDIFVDI
ncbi:hypothetical protein IPL68_06410 [Candidatus Saccharibacteria bacterium]|nr:MAG: hypothetical protein IPL68_06410 [Candidatus Saccharibacteria bacterium]